MTLAQNGATSLELIPFPLSLNLCGLSTALSFSFTRALRPPVRAGVKVTSIMQALFEANVVPVHVSFRIANAVGLSPPRLALSMDRGCPPVVFTLILVAARVLPTSCLPRSRLSGVRLTDGGDGGGAAS